MYDVVNTAGHLLGFCRAKAGLSTTPRKEKPNTLKIEVDGHWFRDYVKTMITWGEEMLPGRKEEV